jgi:hypothetical protein
MVGEWASLYLLAIIGALLGAGIVGSILWRPREVEAVPAERR